MITSVSLISDGLSFIDVVSVPPASPEKVIRYFPLVNGAETTNWSAVVSPSLRRNVSARQFRLGILFSFVSLQWCLIRVLQ